MCKFLPVDYETEDGESKVVLNAAEIAVVVGKRIMNNHYVEITLKSGHMVCVQLDESSVKELLDKIYWEMRNA